MDPISGIILIGILVMAGAKTAASGATDFMAQKKGNTPPSLEKWRKREERRQSRGDRPSKEPGPWRRRWNNSIELSTEKAAQKHQARLEHLREQGRDNVDRHKDKLRKRAERQDRIGSALAGVAGSSWDTAKNAAAAPKERHAERQAWAENEQRDAAQEAETEQRVAAIHQLVEPVTLGKAYDAATSDAERHAVRERALQLGYTEFAAILGTHRGKHEAYRKAVKTLPERPASLAELDRATGRAEEEAEATLFPGDAGQGSANVLSLTRRPGKDGTDKATATSPAGNDSNNTGGPGGTSDLQGTNRRGLHIPTAAEAEEMKRRAIEKDPSSAAKFAAIDRMFDGMREYIATHPQNSDYDGRQAADDEGNSPMTTLTHSGEITDLPSAISYVDTNSQYCDSVSGTFEDAQAQAKATAQDLQSQFSTLENAQAALAGEGFGPDVTGRFNAVQEHFTTVVANMQQVENLLASTHESISAAKAELNSAGTTFRGQMGLAEEVQAQQSVAKNTDFYANA